MTQKPPASPLITIIGATGTGKSQLAVSLAKRYNGEIINGDAMQLYAGLPVITNKITTPEQQGVPHHLLGCIGLNEQTWVVGTFVKKALATIDDIRSRGKLPILVGGTHYYTQNLLFEDRLAEGNDEAQREFVPDTAETWPVLLQPTHLILEELKKVDPVMADRWHPNDRRKIQRSLEIYLQTGKKASEIYAEQRLRKQEDANAASSLPTTRFPTLLFWVHADADALQARLDKRVDTMLQQGLLEEVETLDDFQASEEAHGRSIDETRGIWVSIGYKEFRAYSKARHDPEMAAVHLQKLHAEAVERTKIATRQYAKRQLRWIRIKLVNALADARVSKNLYLLDGSDVSSFNHAVLDPACDLTAQYLQGNPMPEPTSISSTAETMLTPKRDYDLAATPERWTKRQCEVCGVTCVTEEQWGLHVKSKAHRKLVSKRKAEQQRQNGENAQVVDSSNTANPP